MQKCSENETTGNEYNITSKEDSESDNEFYSTLNNQLPADA